MNSKQRRVDRRLWKYSVPLTLRDYDHYLEIWDWLKERYSSNAARCGWRDRNVHYTHNDTIGSVWQFYDEKKLVEFMLRWS
jgi:hypothetical protein